MTTNDPTWVSAVPTPDTYLETAIVITVPDTMDPETSQVLVRIPGHIDPKDISVDFRPSRGATWMPSDFFPDTVEVNHQ